MRLFIAIELPESVKEVLFGIQRTIGNDLAKVRYAGKEQMHLTLKFLSEVSTEKTSLIKENLKKIKNEAFSFSLDKIGVFPNDNYVKVVWVGVEPEKEVVELQSKIEEALSEFHFKKDFDFHPHITIGRVAYVKDKKSFIEKLHSVSVDRKKVDVNDFKLIKSTLTPEGPVYEVVEGFSF